MNIAPPFRETIEDIKNFLNKMPNKEYREYSDDDILRSIANIANALSLMAHLKEGITYQVEDIEMMLYMVNKLNEIFGTNISSFIDTGNVIIADGNIRHEFKKQ